MNYLNKIESVVELIRESAHPDKIILFGSTARGDADTRSDIDFIVVESEVKDRVAEMTRLGRILSPLRFPVDILVVSRESFARWAGTPGNVYYRAMHEGRVLYDAA